MVDSAFQNPLSSFFFAGRDDVPQALRQKIALAMMMRSRAAAPKNLGEGLNSIGDSISDVMTMRGVYNDAAAGEGAGRAAESRILGTVPPSANVSSRSYAPTDRVEPEQPAIAPAKLQMPASPAESPETGPLTAVPPPLTTTPPGQQPPSMFNPAPMGRPTPPMPSSMTPPPGPQAGTMVDPAQANSIDTAGLADRTFARQRGIAGIESGGAKDPYALLGAQTRTGDRAYGKYQVMGANIPSWTQAALGQSMTPQQFLANPQAQDDVFNHRFGQYADKYGEQGAAKAWYAGERGMNNPNATDLHGRLTVADYGNDFTRRAGAPDPRAAAAAALMAQQAPAGGLPPEITAGQSQPDQRLAFNGAQPPAPSQIRSAPPPSAPPPADRRPPTPAAPPPAQPGYVLPLPPKAVPPPTMTPVMQRIQEEIRNAPPAYRDSVKERLTPLYQQEQAKISRMETEYKDQLTQDRALEIKHHEQRADQAKRITENQKEQEAVTKAQQENQLRAQFGNMPPDEVFKTLNESKKVASSAAKSLIASSDAMKALEGGAILGSGAGMRLDVAKFFHGIGLVDKGNVIANTETFRGAMQPVVASILHQTSGTSQLSEGELKFAQRAAAGDITLDPQSVKQLMTIIDKGSRGVIEEHQTKLKALFGDDNKQAHAVYGVETPKPAAAARTKDDDARDWAAQNPNDPRAAEIRKRLGM